MILGMEFGETSVSGKADWTEEQQTELKETIEDHMIGGIGLMENGFEPQDVETYICGIN